MHIDPCEVQARKRDKGSRMPEASRTYPAYRGQLRAFKHGFTCSIRCRVVLVRLTLSKVIEVVIQQAICGIQRGRQFPGSPGPARTADRSQKPLLPLASEHLRYALLNPRSCPCRLASEGPIILRDVARRRMVISQVKFK